MAFPNQFQINAPFPPKGDQPQAIEKLIHGVQDGLAHQVLLGATGTGKTYTACNVIARLQRPTLVIAHNKTLAAQLCQEIREFFPENAVEYFVSYYDYYQPEAYVPHTDTFIEKESSRNDEIDRLRHSATQSVTSRRDVVIVASVSCIYGLGTPELYQKNILDLRVGLTINRRATLEKLVHMQFARNDVNLLRGTFRVRGDVLEIHPRDAEHITRIDTFGDEIESIQIVNNVTGEVVQDLKYTVVFPATHFIADEDRMEGALKQIEIDLEARVQEFHTQGKLLEAQRLQQRVRYDMEMMREVGYCNGIENYSRYLDGRAPGAPPYTLLNYFPKDYLLIVDESHQTMPQIRAMYAGDRSRKEVLIEYGFRLPAAFDNRPLKFEEFEGRVGQTIFTSATPGPYELEHIGLERKTIDDGETKRAKSAPLPFELPKGDYPGLAQQIIRPTGLIDPEIIIRPTRGQIDDLLGEIRNRVSKNQRVLVTTLTKRMAEDLSEYLKELNVKVNYLHSDVITMERSTTLRELRQGKYDVVVGINLLREGLDLPEVSLVAILDADKEGFLRSETSLIQTIGRAARHVEGQVVMYADRITGSMQRAINETNRRRAAQVEYNELNGITPQSIQKAIRDDLISELLADARAELTPSQIGKPKPKPEDLPKILSELESEMKAAAAALDFERAAQLRDELLTLRELV
jgi:excinuclease ABC subunit B